MKFFTRLLMALLALAGAIAWTIFSEKAIYFFCVMACGGDGSGAGQGAVALEILLVGVILWALPMVAFVFMLLGSFNRPRGIMRSVGYWYALVVLVIVAGLFFILFRHVHLLRWIGLVFMLAAMFWGYAFRKKPPCDEAVL
jgi:small-conductance mechanosensitive channel